MKMFARACRNLSLTVALIIIVFCSYAAAGTEQLTLGSALSDSLSQSAPTKTYSFTLHSPALVTLRLTRPSTWTDLRASIVSSDAASQYLYVNTYNNGTDLTRSVALAAGSYLVKVEPDWAGYYSSYGLTVSASFGGNYEAEKNETPQTATLISTGTPFTGVLAPLPPGTPDVDYYRFTLDSASYLTLRFSHGQIPADPMGIDPIFWNASIRSADDAAEYLLLESGAATETTRAVALPAGSYLVKVARGWGGTDHSSYTFSVNPAPLSALETESNETAETATAIAMGTSYTGIVAPLSGGVKDADFYRFTPPASRPVLINFNHEDTGVADRVWNVRVIDGAGQEYLSFDSAGTATRSSYGTALLSAGTPYYVKITSYSVPYSLNNRYELSVTPDSDPPYVTNFPMGGIYDHSIVVTLTCHDGTQSGCDKIYYTTDGSTPTTSSAVYSGPIAIPDNFRRFPIKHFAVDLAGNSGMVTTQFYDVDTINPVTAISPAGDAFRSATTVTLSCSDVGVGCDTIVYTTDGSYPGSESTKPYSGPILVTETTTLTFFAIDRAGNGEEAQRRVIHIDGTPPESAAPAGGASTTDSVVWSAQPPQDSHYVQNGVIAVDDTIFTIGGRINAYQSDISSGYILSGSDGGTWEEVFNDFVPYCYNSATWGRACDSSLYGVTGTGTPFAVVGAMGHIRTEKTAVVYASSGTDKDLYAVTWASFLGKYIAVGAEGTITTSADGATWSVQAAATTQALRSVTGSGNRLVAVGARGTILTSTDGAAWSPVASGVSDDLHGVTWSEDAEMYVAVGANGAILTSDDGLLWERQNSRVFDTLNAVAASADQFVAVGKYGTVVASLDGVLWTEQPSGTTEHLNAVTWSGTKFFAVGVAGSWITGVERVPAAATTKKISLTCYDGPGSGCDKIYYTTDGSTPTTASTVYSGAFDISGATTLKFFAVDRAGNAEQPKTEVYTFSTGQAPPARGSLTVTLDGTGTGSLNSNPSGFTCLSGSCTWSYTPGSTLSVLASPASDSVFTGWSGDCSGTGNCSLIMEGYRNVTATFTRVLPVRLVGTQQREFESLQEAFNEAPLGATVSVNAREREFVENLLLERDVAVKLTGGYDIGYLTAKGTTRVDGKLTVRKGRLTVKGVAIK